MGATVNAHGIKPGRIVAVVALAIGLVLSLPAPGNAGDAIGWVVECPLSHRLQDDPIVYPNEPGAAHLHEFFGNVTTDATSTYGSLRDAGTTCSFRRDTSAYWTPALSIDGAIVAPNDFDFYYITITSPHERVRAFPRGLRVIAGDAHATEEQPRGVVQWTCDGSDSDPLTRPPDDCGGRDLVARVKFPDCWDGERLDSRNHRAHMAYSVEREGSEWHRCPRSHPVPVPKLIYRLQWPIQSGEGVELSSGPARSLHADFFNSWDQRALRRLVRTCIQAGVNCGRVND